MTEAHPFDRLRLDVLWETRMYFEVFGCEARLVPRRAAVEQLSRAITPEAVYIDDMNPDDPEMGLLFDCTWDRSHGVGVRLRGDTVLEIGPRDFCL